MKETQNTAESLVQAGTDLFAERGYDATSVRAITRRAGANLGAITYHFGSKDEFYEAVVASVVEPSLEYLARIVGTDGPPLERIERFVRGLFSYLGDHPEFPRLIMQHLAGSRPLPAAFRRVIQGNLRTLVGLISEGQRDGSVRAGNPRLLAPSIVAQPIYLTLARQPLREGAGIDLDEPAARRELVESVVEFVRAGLTIPEKSGP